MRYLSLLLLLGIAAAAAAQNVQVVSGAITDKRQYGDSPFAGELEVELVIKGDVVAHCRGLRQLSVTKAVDDKGTNLLKEDSNGHSGVYYFERKDGEEPELNKRLSLKNPARAAGSMEISGSIELYAPAKDPKASVAIKSFMQQAGKPISSDALKKAKIEMTVLTKTQYEAVKKKEEEEKSAKSPKDPLVAAIADLMSGLFDVGENDLLYLIKDPNHQLVDLEVRDASGKPLSTGSRSASGDKMIIGYDQLPAKDAQLVLYLATPASVIKTPFHLTNLELP